MIYHPPVIFSKPGLKKSSGSVSSGPARTNDLSQEILRKRPAFYRPSVEKADDLERERQLAEETKLANSLSEKKLAVPGTGRGGTKKNEPPDFDDGAIKWVGRII